MVSMQEKYLDDEFLDWETRAESIPLWKHMIAGKSLNQKCSPFVCQNRLLRRNRGTLLHVPRRYDKSKSKRAQSNLWLTCRLTCKQVEANLASKKPSGPCTKRRASCDFGKVLTWWHLAAYRLTRATSWRTRTWSYGSDSTTKNSILSPPFVSELPPHLCMTSSLLQVMVSTTLLFKWWADTILNLGSCETEAPAVQ